MVHSAAMALSRRDALILGGIGLGAAAAGIMVAPLLLRSGAGAEALAAARFSDLQGKSHAIAEWQGKVLVCNFWATWCPPCREEIPLLSSERTRLSAKGVEVVGIAVDSAANVAEFAKNSSVSYPILIGDASVIDLMRKLGNESGALPYTVFLDRTGAIAARKLGALQRAELEKLLASLLNG
ncbi:MAG: TlpA disulfide reductase family protein [Burkholderiales bacterium]